MENSPKPALSERTDEQLCDEAALAGLKFERAACRRLIALLKGAFLDENAEPLSAARFAK